MYAYICDTSFGFPVQVFLTSLFLFLQNESELFGRTIRVNIAKPMRIKEGSSRPGDPCNNTGPQGKAGARVLVLLTPLCPPQCGRMMTGWRSSLGRLQRRPRWRSQPGPRPVLTPRRWGFSLAGSIWINVRMLSWGNPLFFLLDMRDMFEVTLRLPLRAKAGRNECEINIKWKWYFLFYFLIGWTTSQEGTG